MTDGGRNHYEPARSKVAILLSTYNGVDYLREQLDSILAQTYRDWVLVVRDDGSRDETLAILSEYVEQDSRITVIVGNNVGVVRSFFELLETADDSCGYFSLSDQDDVWHREKLERAVSQLAGPTSSEIQMYCSRQEYVDADLVSLGLSAVPRRFDFYNALIENAATGCTVVLNRAARSQLVSRLPAEAIMHDWWFYLVVSCFGRIVFDEFPSLKYRQHSSNQIGASASRIGRLGRRLRRHLLDHRQSLSLVDQAIRFEAIYGNDMALPFRDEIRRLIRSKQSIRARLLYAITTKLRRSRVVDSFLFRVLILLNRY